MFSVSIDPYCAGEGMKRAIFLRVECFAARLTELKPRTEHLRVFRDMLPIGGEQHDRTECRHLGADRPVAHLPAWAATFAVAAPPERVALPVDLADHCDLDAAKITVKDFDVSSFRFPALLCYFAGVCTLLLEIRILVRHLTERLIEEGYLLLDLHLQPVVLLESLFLCRIDICGL